MYKNAGHIFLIDIIKGVGKILLKKWVSWNVTL